MKTYVKPDLYYENFELSQHVATCMIDMPDSNDVQNCYAYMDPSSGDDLGGVKLFNNLEVCESIWEEYCYTNGAGNYNIFNS